MALNGLKVAKGTGAYLLDTTTTTLQCLRQLHDLRSKALDHHCRLCPARRSLHRGAAPDTDHTHTLTLTAPAERAACRPAWDCCGAGTWTLPAASWTARLAIHTISRVQKPENHRIWMPIGFCTCKIDATKRCRQIARVRYAGTPPQPYFPFARPAQRLLFFIGHSKSRSNAKSLVQLLRDPTALSRLRCP